VYYDWRPPAACVSVRLNYGVIDRLKADIMKGFWAVPKRGAEIGGVLIGSASSSPGGGTVVTVDDYERVACEYRRGPSYVLSEPDRKRLARALRRGGGRSVVGYFRSHTRPGLYLDANDMAIVETFFSGENDVVLLVRPHASAPAVGGFFVWEQGDMRRHTSYQEFPFDTAALAEAAGSGAPGARAPVMEELVESERAQTGSGGEPEPAPAGSAPAGAGSDFARAGAEHVEETAAPPSPARPPGPRPRASEPPPARSGSYSLPAPDPERPAEAPRRGRIWRPRAMAGVYAAFILAALGVMEYQIVSGRAGARAGPGAEVASLRVDRNGNSLSLLWDPAAPAVRSAERGVLLISEGGVEKQIPLDRAHLAAGRVAYAPSGNDVTFRLELHQRDRKVSEAVRVITGQAPPPHEAGAAVKPQEAARIAPQSRRRPRAFVDDGL